MFIKTKTFLLIFLFVFSFFTSFIFIPTEVKADPVYSSWNSSQYIVYYNTTIQKFYVEKGGVTKFTYNDVALAPLCIKETSSYINYTPDNMTVIESDYVLMLQIDYEMDVGNWTEYWYFLEDYIFSSFHYMMNVSSLSAGWVFRLLGSDYNFVYNSDGTEYNSTTNAWSLSNDEGVYAGTIEDENGAGRRMRRLNASENGVWNYTSGHRLRSQMNPATDYIMWYLSFGLNNLITGYDELFGWIWITVSGTSFLSKIEKKSYDGLQYHHGGRIRYRFDGTITADGQCYARDINRMTFTATEAFARYYEYDRDYGRLGMFLYKRLVDYNWVTYHGGVPLMTHHNASNLGIYTTFNTTVHTFEQAVATVRALYFYLTEKNSTYQAQWYNLTLRKLNYFENHTCLTWEWSSHNVTWIAHSVNATNRIHSHYVLNTHLLGIGAISLAMRHGLEFNTTLFDSFLNINFTEFEVEIDEGSTALSYAIFDDDTVYNFEDWMGHYSIYTTFWYLILRESVNNSTLQNRIEASFSNIDEYCYVIFMWNNEVLKYMEKYCAFSMDLGYKITLQNHDALDYLLYLIVVRNLCD